MLQFSGITFLDRALPLNLLLILYMIEDMSKKKNPKNSQQSEGCLVGAQVPVSPSIDILVMVHKTGNRIFFLSDLLTVVICLFESKMKSQKILNVSFFNSQDFLPVEKKKALHSRIL